MHDEITSSYRTCKDLQSLIHITFNDVIKPLREAFKGNPKSKIIALEIKDAENKVFEYISSQITTIGNASEEDSSICLKEFPKSDICYRCIGLDDDTIQLVTRLVDNKSTIDDIGIIGIPSWSESTNHQETKENSENNIDSHSSKITFNSHFLYNESQYLSKCLSNLNENTEHRRSVSDCHPSSIISTKRPINHETLLKAFKSNTTLSGITCNDDKSYLSTNQLVDLNSLSVPNTPNVQKSRSVGGSEEILTDLPHPSADCSIEFGNSPQFIRKNYPHVSGKLKLGTNRNIQLQRSLSHEFESKNLLNLKDNDFHQSNQFPNQQFQASVFQFNPENLSAGNFNIFEKERRSSYEEKLIYKSSTMSCDFNAIIRPLSPGFSGKKSNDTNNGNLFLFHRCELFDSAGFRIPGSHK